MRIERIEIAGFGKLHSLNIKLAPRINLFFGENEAGKSTLQQAILALLYGFYEGSRATKVESEQWKRLCPWQGGAYGGALEYILDNERCFRIERDFRAYDMPTKLFDLATGQDITDDFGIGRHGNVPVARRQLGMPRSVFISSAFISQGAIKQFEESYAVGDTIVSLADTGKRDISAAKAIEALDIAIRKRVGTEKSRVTPLAGARRRLSDARDELQRYKSVKQSIQMTLAEKEKLSEQLRQTKQDLEKATLGTIIKQTEDVDDRLSRIDYQEQRITKAKAKLDELREYADFPKELHEEVVRAKQSLNDAGQHFVEVGQMLREKKDQLDETNAVSEYEALSNTIGQLSDSEYEELHSIQHQLNQTKQLIEQRRQHVEALKAKRASIKPWLIALAVLLPPIGIPLLLWYRSRAKRDIQRGRDEVQKELESLVAEQESAAIQLEKMLSKYKVNNLEEIDKNRLRYFQIKSSITEYTNLQTQLEEAELQVKQIQQTLLRIFQKAGIMQKDYQEAMALFEKAYEEKLQYEQAESEFKSAESEKRQILGKQTLGELIEIKKKLHQQKDTIIANHPELAGLLIDKSLEQLNEEHDYLDEQRETLERQILGCEKDIEASLSAYRSRAEIEEDLARHQKEVDKLLLFRASLELAKEMIETVADEVHRDFAPKLARAVGSGIAVVTSERYTTTYVDPTNLSVKVRIPETGQLMPTERLSFGTEEQIYLLLRVELARLMSNLGERIPIFLDDSLVNFDNPRLMKTLDFLVSLSRETQVLLFSKELHLLEWFHSSLEGDDEHRLLIMSPSGSIE